MGINKQIRDIKKAAEEAKYQLGQSEADTAEHPCPQCGNLIWDHPNDHSDDPSPCNLHFFEALVLEEKRLHDEIDKRANFAINCLKYTQPKEKTSGNF